ncbi:MAG: DUF2336 domain-containing protein [Rickettsiales bacterium]|nr:DUF2336 domain-containing protein [Pseudomonadota bacterium]MDA0967113.1 DUF2336 domain-containing protein [Pseudomonadota bacterium]MDG4542401.1 DUF2336 domain-containing protein [Rickettsiales bacterium]MDG4544905.1 DUF2336 domain-containing protein [Rickettsiales bacterium]MDG4547028.1 DUF2336 domain-containing protein [Rickettsiales bacterium]
MSAEKNIVSHVDIELLLNSPLEAKIDVIKKIGKYYTEGSLSIQQKEAVERILSTLIKESDTQVKQGISESIKSASNASNELVMQLAQDIDIVAIPILEFSKALTDENLIYIIERTDDIEKQKIISKREAVSEGVSEALIHKGHEDVVVTLLNNKGAAVSEDGYKEIVEKFPEVKNILGSIKQRAKVPLSILKTVKEKLIVEGDEQDIDNKKSKQDVDKEYYQFTQVIKKRGVQDNIAPIYALCMGNIKLFETCVARKLKAPVMNVRKILDSDASNSFSELYKRVGLPDNLFDSTETLLCVLNNLSEELPGTGVKLSDRDSKRIITNMLMFDEEEGGIENIEYIITLIKSTVEGNG